MQYFIDKKVFIKKIFHGSRVSMYRGAASQKGKRKFCNDFA